jgi:hypothetical protein
MRRRAIHVGAAVLTAATLVAGCAAPEFTYVKNSGEKTYFKVPHEWHQTGTDGLDDALAGTTPESASSEVRQQLWWSVAYDAAADPDSDHLLTKGVTMQPIVYARVAQLTKSQRDSVSLDMLRNSFLPVTEDVREASANTIGLQGFELLQDDVLTPASGLHGVRVVYDYELTGGIVHTFDLTALVNNDSSKVYMLLIRCAATCYRDRAGELGEIAKSFTVRS